MAASNTPDCFREFVGKRVKGVLFDALPLGRADLSAGTKTLVFEDGRGLTIAHNGGFWIDSPEHVERAVIILRKELEAAQRGLKDILALAGEPV